MRIKTAFAAGTLTALISINAIGDDANKGKHGEMKKPMAGGMATNAGMDRTLVAHISAWPEASRMAAKDMITKYGSPAERTATMLVWHNNGPWKRTVIYSHEVPHHFPMAHTDVMEQFIDYKVPVGMADELTAYDGSVVVFRTNGELSARCDKEAMNLLAINLANDVATGKASVEEARKTYGMTAMAFKKGKKSEYTTKLAFDAANSGTPDPDKPLTAKTSQR